jgi:hypothetical protein
MEQIKGRRMDHYKPVWGFQETRSTTAYQQEWGERFPSLMPLGQPTSVMAISSTRVNKLQEGPQLVNDTAKHTTFWDFLQSWGGGWIWEDIDFKQDTMQDLT